MEEKLAFYKQKWFMWLTLILFAPLGIFLMWKFKKFDNKKSIILTNVFIIWFFVFLIPIGIGVQVNNVTQAHIQEQQLIESNKKAAQYVDQKITAIGDPKAVKLEKLNEVKSIRTAYDNLSSDQQVYVTNVALLTTAEKTIADLQAKKVADEKIAADKVAADKAAADKAVADKAAADKAAADKAAADQAAADQAAAKAAATQQATAQKSATTETQSAEVYITKTGEKYHLAGCQSLSKSQIPISLSDAKSRGYTACENCDPPQ